MSIITIAGIYNLPEIPEFAVRSVIFHEMLHIAVPPIIKNGRRVVHGTAFKTAEKRNPDLVKWIFWEKGALRQLLRKKKPLKKRLFGLFL